VYQLFGSGGFLATKIFAEAWKRFLSQENVDTVKKALADYWDSIV
jgi:hypothetical protein